MGDQLPPMPGTPEAKANGLKGFIVNHKVWSAIIALVVVGVIATAAGSGPETEEAASPSSPAATPSSTPSSTPSTPVVVTIEVPKLVGLSDKEARAALQQAANEAGGNASFVIVVTEEYSSKPTGLVFEAHGGNPGTEVPSGTTITLVIAKKIPSMPNVVGMKVKDATNELEALGYAVETKTKGSSSPPGTVLGQSVSPGAKVIPDGTTVKLTVAKVPPLTVSQENAISMAYDYLDYTSFSASGLVDQLEYEGFSTADAQFAVDHISVNWNQQAVKTAKDYLDYSSFSCQGLIDQLEYEGFTTSQATYGVNQTGLCS